MVTGFGKMMEVGWINAFMRVDLQVPEKIQKRTIFTAQQLKYHQVHLSF